jgi:hypothetical protein
MDFRIGRVRVPADQVGGSALTPAIPCLGARQVMFGFKGTAGTVSATAGLVADVVAMTGAFNASPANGMQQCGASTTAIGLGTTILWTGFACNSPSGVLAPYIPYRWFQGSVSTAGTLSSLELWLAIYFEKFYPGDKGMANWDEKYWQSILV